MANNRRLCVMGVDLRQFGTSSQELKLLVIGFLRRKAVRGGMWLLCGSVLSQGVRFGRNIVLTRLLVPESFGLMSIVLSVSFIVDALTEIGIKEAIIQSPRGDSKEFVNSAWWLSLGRSLLIYGSTFALAPVLARFYHNPELTWLLRLALLSVVFNGAMSPNAYVALKRMNYKKWALLQYGIGVGGTLITVGLTLTIRSVWALAIGFAAEYGMRCLASHVLCPFVPKLVIKGESTRDLLNFSRGVVGLSALNCVFSRSDVFVLGGLIRPEELGIYTISVYLAQVPASFAMELLAQVFMPIFANIRNDFGEINKLLSRIMFAVIIVCLPALTFFISTGRTLLAGLYGHRYSAGFWPLVVAIIVAFINIANAQITTVLYALGRPHAHRIGVGAMAASMVVLLYPATRLLGPVGAQLSALIAMLIGFGIQVRQINRLTGFRVWTGNRRIAAGMIGAGTIFASSLLAVFAIPDTSFALRWIIGSVGFFSVLAAGILISTNGRDLWILHGRRKQPHEEMTKSARPPVAPCGN